MDQINQILSSSKRVLVTSHLQPDPDAICSALGVFDYLLKVFPDIDSQIFLSGDKLESYKEFKNYEKVNWVKDISEVAKDFDTLFFVDASQLDRFTKNPELINLENFKSICIDHHINTVSKFTYSIIETESPSCAELIYKHLFLNNTHLIDSYVAEILLSGILSDTAFLKYVLPTELNTFDHVKSLIEISDMDLSRIEEKYFSYTQSDWDIIQELTKNIVKVDNVAKPYIYTFVPVDFINKYPLNLIKQGKAKFLQLFGISIQGYKWCFAATPINSELMNLSFRSAANVVNVREMAANFNGGGHDLTSGGEFEILEGETSEQVSKKISEKINTLL